MCNLKFSSSHFKYSKKKQENLIFTYSYLTQYVNIFSTCNQYKKLSVKYFTSFYHTKSLTLTVHLNLISHVSSAQQPHVARDYHREWAAEREEKALISWALPDLLCLSPSLEAFRPQGLCFVFSSAYKASFPLPSAWLIPHQVFCLIGLPAQCSHYTTSLYYLILLLQLELHFLFTVCLASHKNESS